MNHNNQKLREQHSIMEGQRSSSYAIFADAQEYWFSYDPYLDLFRQYAQQKETVYILNIGAATGILEYLALRDIPNLHFVSVDNSNDFTELFQKKNKEAIEAGKVEHVFSSIQDFSTDQRFDIIVSRDFNHHIEMDVVEQYIKHCYGMLNEGGSFVIEDLKREAEEVGINDLVKVVYSIDAFHTDDYNRYHKIMGIIDSYFVAYHTDEMSQLLDRMGLPYELQNEKYRYKFIIKNDATKKDANPTESTEVSNHEGPAIIASEDKSKLFRWSCETVCHGIDKQKTIKIASGYLRFLSALLNPEQTLSKEQRTVIEFLRSDGESPFRIQVLLYAFPNENSEIVKMLIKKGAEVKFLYKSKERFRLALIENEIHLSISDNKDIPVVRGFNCSGNEAKQLIDYFHKRFDDEFEQATKLIIENDTIQSIKT